MWQQEAYIKALRFASEAHTGQYLPGSDIPYINHLANVAMEVMSVIARGEILGQANLAVQCALLHDCIEDTAVSYDEITIHFGKNVADGVLSLTKNKKLPSKSEQMADSLERIRGQAEAVWCVKLADRITNLQPPPSHWKRDKALAYQQEAQLILNKLKAASPLLAIRLEQKINDFTGLMPDE